MTRALLSSAASTTSRGNVATSVSSVQCATTIGASTLAPAAMRTVVTSAAKSPFMAANTSVGSLITEPTSVRSSGLAMSTPGTLTSTCAMRPFTTTTVAPRTGTVASAASIGSGISVRGRPVADAG